jgi:hypothetical protein
MGVINDLPLREPYPVSTVFGSRRWASFALLCVVVSGCRPSPRYGWPAEHPPWAVAQVPAVFTVSYPEDKVLSRAPDATKGAAYTPPLAWSPDAKLVSLNTYTACASRTGVLWNLSRKRLTRLPAGYACFGFHPDGGKLLCIHDKELVQTKLDGSLIRTIASGPVFWATWGPDGKRIAATRGNRERCDLVILGADGKLERVLDSWNPRTGGHGAGISWSPDGRWIAFSRYTSDGPAIYLVPTRGGRPKRTVQGAYPTWVPRGGHLAYTRRDRPDLTVGLYVAQVQGQSVGRSKRIPMNTPYAYFAAWAPDGGRFAILIYQPVALSERDLMPPPGSR